jgi:AraC family transcriptional regulator, transcriptional activator of pobA
MRVTTPAGLAEKPAIPHFFLYGEEPRDVDDRFLHLEALDDRSRPSNWHIRPHTHHNLHHLILVQTGGGESAVDEELTSFEAPAILIVPARLVHGFSWLPESTGQILTISESYLARLLTSEPPIRGLFVSPLVMAVPAGNPAQRQIEDGLKHLARELTWSALGHESAVKAHLLSVLVEILRLSHWGQHNALPGTHAETVARFREIVETGFRTRRKVESYAEELGISMPRLRAACIKATDKPPIQLIQDRILLEAKRLLLYSNMTVKETAYYLGFDDPAYFSRLFFQSNGLSPRNFRKRQAKPDRAVL